MEEIRWKGRILLVDDAPDTIEMVKTALEREGYKVFVATNGEKALKRAILTAPDLILLDILMPGMDGYETCRQLKADETTTEIPVIFMSALTETFDKVKGFNLGAVDYVVKPIATEELLVRVRTHITLSEMQKALEDANASLEERVLARTEELCQSNARLQEEIAERKQAEKQIKAALEEKSVLLREIHHRTRNNMQVIQSLLHLQSQYFEDEHMLQLFQNLQNRIHSMALVHKKLYRSDLTTVNFKEYILELAQYLLKNSRLKDKRFSFEFDTETILLSVDSAVPCGLMLDELITNALQHAFPEEREGKIRISLHPVERGRIELRVGDNGIGVPEDFEVRETPSLGLQLVRTIVEYQLGGTIEFKQGNTGTEVIVRFKPPHYTKRI